MHALITFPAQYLILVPVVAWVGILAGLQTKSARLRFAAETVASAVFVVLLARIGSALYNNPRPYIVAHIQPYFSASTDNGFPSDHMLLSSSLAMLVWYHNRRWGWVLLAVAVIIGLARVAGKVHHLVDIVGALAFAVAGVSAGVYLTRWSFARYDAQRTAK